MKNILEASPDYKRSLAYGKKDALTALGVYSGVILLYFGAGYLRAVYGSIIPAILANILLAAAVFIAMRARGQTLGSVGLTTRGFKRALAVGAAVGFIFFALNITLALISGGKWTGLAATLWNFFYMLVIIAFAEELIFRGYIQTRLYGAIKSDVLANVVGGLMFMGIHLPFQVFNRSGGDFGTFISSNYSWLLTTFAMHFIFNFLYRKYNSLTAPLVCHLLVNYGSTLFK